MGRWLDRAFFSLLIGACLYIVTGKMAVSLLAFGTVLLLHMVIEKRRWCKYRQKLWQKAQDELRREDWLKQKALSIREAKGVILYPTPDMDSLTGLCLQRGQSTSFHCFGDIRNDLVEKAAAFGCTVSFHPWGEGATPSRDQIIRWLERNAPKRDTKLWKRLLHLPGGRYLLTGCLLLLLSILLRRALYWRLLGTLCLLIGALRRSFQTIGST